MGNVWFCIWPFFDLCVLILYGNIHNSKYASFCVSMRWFSYKKECYEGIFIWLAQCWFCDGFFYVIVITFLMWKRYFFTLALRKFNISIFKVIMVILLLFWIRNCINFCIECIGIYLYFKECLMKFLFEFLKHGLQLLENHFSSISV